MICLLQNDLIYDYDIRSLIHAFYSNEKITTDEEGARLLFQMNYETNCITASLIIENETIESQLLNCNYQDKKTAKNQIKRLVYKVLSECTGILLPWGTLTGIRPTKIAVELIEEGRSMEEVSDYFHRTYLTSWQKAKTSAKVASKELSILQSISYEKEFSVYIGIPFCPSTCLYCSFTSYPIKKYEALVEDYLQALYKEIDFVAENYKDQKLITLYIGGGTPTSLSGPNLNNLLTKIRSTLDLTNLSEFTVEAGRPDSITYDKLKVLYENGVTRISINPQTMKDETLRLIGRAHTTRQTIEAYHLAREIGFDNINMDIIVGLPGEDLSDIEQTLKEIEQLKPDSLTVHSLAIKRASNLNIHMEEYRSLVKGSTNEMLELVDDYAQKLGLNPYYLYRQKNIPGNLENIGYSRTGLECLYNILIMEEKQTILALGAGASSKYVYPKENRIERVENVKDVNHYIDRIDEMIERKKALL